jgi:hypothetical protein
MHRHFLHRYARAILAPLLLILLAAAVPYAQEPTATISGIVTDPSGAVVPAAKVTMTDKQRGVPVGIVTNAEGVYRIMNLIPSTYQVTVEAAGFRTYVVGSFPLATSQEAVFNIALEIGMPNQTIEVKEQVQMVDPSNSSLTGLTQNAQLANLPNKSRYVLAFAALLPGITPANPNNFQVNTGGTANRFIFNGGLECTSELTLDGVSIQDQSGTGYEVTVFPSLEGVEEFRVLINGYSAAYGRSGGGVMSMVTKSGTNAYHGGVFGYLKNSAFNANSFFNNLRGLKKAVTADANYGGSFGGPVIKNKTFVFGVYERTWGRSGGGVAQYSVPTALERQGNFSQSYGANGQLQTIYNPFTTRPDPNNPGQYIRDPFQGNVIPQSLLDPVALKMISYYPTANSLGQPISGTSLFRPVNNAIIGSTPSQSPMAFTNLRVDHNLSSTKRIMGRWDKWALTIGSGNNYQNAADTSLGPQVTVGNNLVLSYNQSIGSATVLDLRVGGNRLSSVRTNPGLGTDVVTTLGLPQSFADYAKQGNVAQFPMASIANYSGLGNNGYYRSGNTVWIFSASLTRVLGRHTLTAGVQSQNYFMNPSQIYPFTGSFSNAMTQGPNPRTVGKGNSIASFLLGTGDNGNIPYVPLVANASHYYAEYIQDDFKLTPRLTINAGFRIEQETGTTERYDRMSAIDPTVLNPMSQQVGFSVYGGYVFAGSGPDSIGRRTIVPLEWKPNPRLGIAYMLNNKTTIRAAYGIFFGQTHTSSTNAYTGSAFSTQTNWLPTLDGITPIGAPRTILSNPFPQGYTYPDGTSKGLLTAVGQNLASAWPDTMKTNYNQQWNLSVQRELPKNMMLQVAYAGNKGVHLALGFPSGSNGPNMNTLAPQYRSLGSDLLTLVPNPFYGKVTGAGLTLSQPTVARQQLLRPYPLWTSVQPLYAPWGNSNYNALQASLQKRFASGSSFIAAYTWSKTLTDQVDGFWGDALYVGSTYQDWYCRSCDKSVSSYDIPHRFTLSGLQELPFGNGKRWLSNLPGFANHILGGWQINYVMTLSNGLPILLKVNQNNTYLYGAGQRPNITSISPVLPEGQQDRNEWFNTAAFSQPANFTFGNAPRTMTAVRNDWIRNLDASIFKDFSINEKFKLQFRAEAFNFTNTPFMGTPNSSFGSSSFGIVSGTANSPRSLMFAFRAMF